MNGVIRRPTPRGPDESAAHRLLLNDVFHILHMDLTVYEEKLQNQARRMARELGKLDPQVLLAGQGIFLSQRLVEQLDHVFIHIVQNALVHGLESAAERLGPNPFFVRRLPGTWLTSSNSRT